MERYNQSEPNMPLTRIVEEIERHLNTERVGRFKMTFPRGDSTHFEIGFQNKLILSCRFKSARKGLM